RQPWETIFKSNSLASFSQATYFWNNSCAAARISPAANRDRHDEVAALDRSLSFRRPNCDGDRVAGKATDAPGIGVQYDLDAFASQYGLDLFCDVAIFTSHGLAARLDDRHAAAEATECLSGFDADVAAAEHDQV